MTTQEQHYKLAFYALKDAIKNASKAMDTANSNLSSEFTEARRIASRLVIHSMALGEIAYYESGAHLDNPYPNGQEEIEEELNLPQAHKKATQLAAYLKIACEYAEANKPEKIDPSTVDFAELLGL